MGAPPETTLKFGGLNDNVDRNFLREMCMKYGKIEECKVYIHEKTKKHSGHGKVVFAQSSSARRALSELDGTSVMGNIIRVSIDRRSKCKN